MAEQQARYLALDVFRGMTVCFMIIVNTPGSWGNVYGPLLHAPWHGFTPTDLVFPSFLFAVGNAMAFSMHKFEGQPNSVFWSKVIKRTLIIFAIGILLYWYPFVRKVDGEWVFKSIEKIRIPGVLQRIALCYFFAAIVIHFGSKKFALWFSVFALLAYWLLSYAFGDPNDPYSLTGNAGLPLDLWLMGPNHLYKGEGIPFDPEGLLSTLPAIVNVVLGYLAGDFIRRHGNSYETIAKLMIAGALLMFVALVWDMAFPINKKIWTSSFVLYTVGLDLLILSILIYIIEMMNSRKWTYFFVVFGRNPLFIYILAGLLLTTLHLMFPFQKFMYKDFYGSFLSPINASLMFALTYMMMNWLVGYILDKNKIYIKV